LRREAFRIVGLRYRDPELPPLVETLEQVEKEPETHVVLKALSDDGELLGAVRAEEHDGVVHIGRLAVFPYWQGRGIGRALAEAIIAQFPDALAFELFTGHRSHAPLSLYYSLGFSVSGVETISDILSLVHLQRPGPAAERTDSRHAS
jgi:ribosomal protein S18 acetylase RimI-like enzyme